MEELSPDDLDDLMSVEENHGRSRVDGAWHGLDLAAGSALEEHFQYIVHVPIHGTRSTYIDEGCRCKSCRRANAEFIRKQRNARKQTGG